jgi:transcriptional regulator with XRE-family HTH domain
LVLIGVAKNRKGVGIMFGEFIKKRRLDQGISLREFCRLMDVDASNWSKIERGVISPPQDDKRLREIASILKIEVGTSLWQEIKDMANIDAGAIPDDIRSESRILNSLPIFFRTLRSEKPEELERLIDFIRKGESSEK